MNDGTSGIETKWASIYSTLNASVRSVGTAVTLASIGIYMHRRGFIVGEGKRTLALISQEVTFPLFLFTKIIYCNQDWSTNPCPDVTETFGDVWILLLWPAYVVGCGILVGFCVAKWTSVPAHQIRAVMAACGFGNSTGLAITLLTVVHANFPSTSDLGRVDPTIFLSVYLLLYSPMQWAIGGFMLAPNQETEVLPPHIKLANHSETSFASAAESPTEVASAIHLSAADGTLAYQNLRQQQPPRESLLARTLSEPMAESFRHNVLNNKELSEYYRKHRRGLSSSDECLYMTELNLEKLAKEATAEEAAKATFNNFVPIPEDGFNEFSREFEDSKHEQQSLLNSPTLGGQASQSGKAHAMPSYQSIQAPDISHVYEDDERPSVWETCQNIASRCFQPPVIGAISGIVCATIKPLRGIFVNLVNRDSSAPLEWLFDGLYSVGLSAVPINMMILGCNLSSSFAQRKSPSSNHSLLSVRTMFGIVIGKMIVLPIIGLASASFLRAFILSIPDDIDSAFYLVMLIVFLTPTANNVMVMVELSGSDAKEGIARVIAMEYAFAPILLSLSMTVAIGFASNWS